MAGPGADLRRLAAIDVRIADLPGDEIGMASGPSITIDRDAARHGWFVDPTPRRDGDTFRGMDLLTAVAHEIGHAAGPRPRRGRPDAGDPGGRRPRVVPRRGTA